MVEAGMPPPPGEKSDFDNPDRTMYNWCIITNAVAIPVCTVFVFLRLFARYRLRMKFQVDDIACIIGYIGFMGYCAICLVMLRYGGGLHQWDVPATQVPYYAQSVYATMVNYGPTVFATKAAILLFLTKVFAPYKVYVKCIYAFLGILAIYYAVMMILKIMICRPIATFWGGADGQCFNQRLLILIDNVFSLVSDLVILILPCPLTRNLQVGWRAKVKIGAVFGVGGIACIFSLVRLVLIINNGESPDQTYAFVEINLTGIAECGIGLVCACFPLMPALWKSILGKDKPGYSYGSNHRSQFEMMNSSEKNSRARGSMHFKSHLADDNSDESILIPERAAKLTTNIRAGELSSDIERGIGESHNNAIDDSQIVRTVEVRQYEEH